MKIKSTLMLFFATLALSTASTQNRRCLPPMGKTPFDAEKFSGEWFVVSGVHTNSPMRMTPSCVRVTYTVTRDAANNNATSVALGVDAKLDGAPSRRLGNSTGVPLRAGRDAVVQAVWNAADGDAKNNSWQGVSRQSVLATDYTSFAVFYACRPIYIRESDTFDAREIVDVWSRTPLMDDKLLEVLKVVLAGYNVPVELMKSVDNTDCT